MTETRKLQRCPISANISATMCSVQHLREFIRERLTAAAEEIFTEVEKTIISYEEELDAQRRMMGISWKPDIKLHRVGSELQRQSSDLQQPSISNEEEAPVIQQVRSLASRSSQDQWTGEEQMDPEPKCHLHYSNMRKQNIHSNLTSSSQVSPSPVIPQVWSLASWSSQDQKEAEHHWTGEEQMEPEPTLLKYEEIYPLLNVKREELDSSVLQHEQQPPEHFPTGQDQKNLSSRQEGEQQTVQKPLAALIETSTVQEDDMNEEETRTERLSLHVSPVVESKDQKGSSRPVSKSQSRTSTKKRSFKCDSCGICYTQQWKLKIHSRTHVSEKTFSCETCEKVFHNF
ncbi:oocyte zinc finger protein XlCOF7.1-like [Poeciliopsis prolifica]|uniref:oocyte zinc finger protein XlCOF7.1-like n=1 Tax=Poeciliopsis prolifica TaxID=188132 RepID=UPI002414338E|nr:oocyte zinc finger protein XlCOF7.1-like [Poeciliopsis prolifica]